MTSNPAEDLGGIWLPGRNFDRVRPPRPGGCSSFAGGSWTRDGKWPFSLRKQNSSNSRVVPGGAQLAYGHRSDRGDLDVRLVSLSGDQKSSPLLQTAFNEAAADFSPDGRYIVFGSDESGTDEVYVAPVAAVGDKIRISSGVVGLLGWSRDGSEIFYSSGQHVMSVQVRTTPSLSLGQPSPLFTLKDGTSLSDVSPDGKRFLAVVEEAGPAPPSSSRSTSS